MSYRTLVAAMGAAVMTVAAGSAGAETTTETLPNWTVTWTNAADTVGTATNDQNDLVLNVSRSSKTETNLTVGTSGVKGSGVASGSGYLDMRGTVTSTTGETLRFSAIRYEAFRSDDGSKNATPALALTGFHSPGTLAANGWSDAFHVDGWPCPTNLVEIILDEPDFTGNPCNWCFNGCYYVTNLVLNLPKVTSFKGPLGSGLAASVKMTTDVGASWNLPSVTLMGNDNFGTLSMAGGLAYVTGVFRLPALEKIVRPGNAQQPVVDNVGFGEVELGLNGNLQRIDGLSFQNCANLTNVVLGASPAGGSLTIASNAFKCANIKDVWFNGAKPVFKEVSTANPAFGLASTPEGQITFHVRADEPTWADAIAEAKANGGLASAATLGTAARQRVETFSGFYTLTVSIQDPRFSDRYHESVTVAFAEDEVRKGYRTGAVTLTATCAAPDDAATDPRRARFLRWDGVPVALERQNPLTYVPAKDTAVQAVFAHDWLMTDDAEPNRTMHNGIWKICCYKLDASKLELGIGKASNNIGKGSMYPSDVDGVNQKEGEGDLNLNGDVWDAAGNKWTIVYTGSLCRWQTESYAEAVANGTAKHFPTRITYPETTRSGVGQAINYDDVGDWPLEEVIMICPNYTSSIGGYMFNGSLPHLRRVVFRIPKVKTFGSSGNVLRAWGAPFDRTDFSEWDLSGVTSVGSTAFEDCPVGQIKGTLDLPNVQWVGTKALAGCSSATGLALGTNGLTLASVGDSAFANWKGLKTLAIGAKPGVVLGGTLGATSVFTNATALAEVRLPGPALATDVVDALLVGVPAGDGAKQVTIHASVRQGWDKLMDALTDAEKAVASDEVDGVYRAGSRKAWFVHEASEYDPKGAFLIIW